MAYTSAYYISGKWRPLTPDTPEWVRTETLIGEAEALLNRLLPNLAAQVASGAVDPTLVTMVVSDAVIRVLQNPAGVTMQTLGPESVQYSGVRQLGVLAFTDAELALLQPDTDPIDGTVTVDGWVVGSAQLRVPPPSLCDPTF